MKQRIGRKNFRHYSFDIETHNDDESIRKQETSMWLGCIIDENSRVDSENSYFYSMDECLAWWEKETSYKRTKKKRPINNVCMWVYNLSFEWSFLLPVLLKHGFRFKNKIEKEDEFVYNSITTKSVSNVWQVQIKFHKNSGIVMFKDIAKIFAGVGGLRTLAKAFNLPTQKGDIDYKKNRLHDYVIPFYEKEYCFKDCKIIVDILQEMQKRNDKEFWSSTSAATYSMKKLLKIGYPKALKSYKKFREEYPILSQEEYDFIRKGTEGGLTYAMDHYQFKVINNKILHIDAHQMHPTQCATKLFPYGSGTYFKGKPPKPFSEMAMVHIRISYTYAKCYSNIKLIGLKSLEDKEIYVWDFEIPTMYKIYEDLKIEYIDGWSYKKKKFPWKDYYKINYRKRKQCKEIQDTFGIMYYKLLNNSSYGKLLEKPHNQIFINVIRDDGVIDSIVEDKPLEECDLCAKYNYAPAGSAIPAYSRVCLIETALKFGIENLVYFDTDSIFCILNDFTWNVWQTQIDHNDFLGGWGLEEISERAQFTAPKRYKLEYFKNGVLVSDVKAAGINFMREEDETMEDGTTYKALKKYIPHFEEVDLCSSVWRVQRAYRVKGGTIIEMQTKQISIQDKYMEIYKQNTM